MIQYNCSHDNDGGFLLICDNGTMSMPVNVGNTGSVVRYNISIHDYDHTFHISGPCRDTKIYNNVFIIGKDAKITVVSGDSQGGSTENTKFQTNIFAMTRRVAFDLGTMKQTAFDSNAFWGAFQDRPADAHAVTKNPMLAAPESARPEPRDVRLMPGSPCIGAGVSVPDNGGRDFWGHPVPASGRLNIGAWQ